MLPPAAAAALRARGHDAVTVHDQGLTGAPDVEVYVRAVDQARVMVTENFADFAQLLQERQRREDRCVPVVFVRRTDFPSRGALATHLARRLDGWAAANPDPVVGLYWA